MVGSLRSVLCEERKFVGPVNRISKLPLFRIVPWLEVRLDPVQCRATLFGVKWAQRANFQPSCIQLFVRVARPPAANFPEFIERAYTRQLVGSTVAPAIVASLKYLSVDFIEERRCVSTVSRSRRVTSTAISPPTETWKLATSHVSLAVLARLTRFLRTNDSLPEKGTDRWSKSFSCDLSRRRIFESL